jgi:hypothetical protein
MGPAVGNRIASAVSVPGDPTTYYAGAASGGIWKATDSARTFAPIFDGQTAQAIGALGAVGAPLPYTLAARRPTPETHRRSDRGRGAHGGG